MNIEQVESNLKLLSENFNQAEFIFELLLSYGTPKATVTLLKGNRHTGSKWSDSIILKRRLFFQEIQGGDLHVTIDSLQKDSSVLQHGPRFIVVTNYQTLLAADTKTGEHLDIPILDIAKHYDFFLPWAGIEKHRHASENQADRKAAEKMAKLYDEIRVENAIQTKERIHDLNVFLTRLLFCFFAEDTNIFESKIFTNSIASHTQADGSDFALYLDTLFDVLNAKNRDSYPIFLQKFPYVNGGLFERKHWIPQFTAKSRKIIIECGELDWSKINPDIFGSMMQAVVHPDERGSLGMHYTSVPNIMKVIGPLFLDDLKEEFENSKDSTNKLYGLLARLSRIKLFDPACGSGNFLIIGYKELRRLEMQILKELHSITYLPSRLKNFYGIEIDDFAHEVAKLSLYLAEHQMNLEYEELFGVINPTLPLKSGGNIVRGNATDLDWEEICPKKSGDEVYVLGNPPFLGSRNQDAEQKTDLRRVFKDGYKSLDYISAWFYLGAKYIKGYNAKLALVSTNSITQGEQVGLLWPRVLSDSLEISFGYKSFKWVNNAKKNAGVTVVIIGLRNFAKGMKRLYSENTYSEVQEITPYLTSGNNIVVHSRTKPLSAVPEMNFGNMPADGGLLLFNEMQKEEFLQKEPSARPYFKELISAEEFLNGKNRYCLWLKDIDKESLDKLQLVKERMKKLRDLRLESSRPKLADVPHLFAQITQPSGKSFILLPCHSSENRDYIPIGLFGPNYISHNSCLIVADAEPWLFALLTSRMHMAWVRAVAGRLKTDFRYSKDVVYNTFPILALSAKQKDELNRYAYGVLEEREKHSEKTLSQMYDPSKMPIGLREAHQDLDLAVERCYRSRPFDSDEDRLSTLFSLYLRMTDDEKMRKHQN